MSIFNNNDYDNNTNITKDELEQKLSGYFNKIEEVKIDYGLNLNSNIYVDNNTINKEKITYVKNVSSDIQTQFTNLSNSIGGVFSNNNSYSGDNIYLGSSSFNQMSLTNNGITTQLNSRELSYLDGTTSNLQQQINNKQNLISNPISNNLVSMNNLGQTINNNISITSDDTLNTTSNNIIPSSTAIKNYVDNKINNLSYESTVGQPVIFYFSNTNNNVVGYEDLLNKPDILPEDIEMIQLNNNRVLLHGYASSALNRTLIPGGIWSFTFYGYVNDNARTTRYEVEIYKRDNNGLETLLGTIMSSDINLSSVNVISFNGTIVNDTITNLTDKLLIKIYGYSNVSNQTINLYFYHSGSNHNSYVSSPLTLSHNDLAGLDTGDYQHLSLIQKQKATQFSNISQDGLLSSANFITFNNKENYINNGLITQYFRGDKSWAILDKNSVGLNNVDNTSDVNKVISNLTQSALDLKQPLINNTVDIVAKSLSDISGNLRNELNLMNTFYQLIYVAGQYGNDLNSGYSILKPKLNIQNAIDNSASNSGVIILISPWVYTQSPITLNKQNITLSAMTYDKSALVSINTLNITSVNSSVRLIGLSINILNISGNCNVYLNCCKINQINKSGNGYFEINECNINQSIYFDCSGSINNIFSSNMPCVLTNSNTANNNQISISNNMLIGPIILIGNNNIIGFNNTPIYSASSSTNAINISGLNNVLYLSNLTILNPDNSNGKILISANNYYSILNVVYNKSTSVFNGIKLTRIMYNNNITSDIVNSENLNFSTTLNNTTPTQLSYLNNVSSDIQTQLNNTVKLSNNNEYTGTNIYYNNLTISNTLLRLYNGSAISFLDGSNNVVNISTSNLNCLKNLTSNVQSSINNMVSLSNDNTFLGTQTFNNTIVNSILKINGSILLNDLSMYILQSQLGTLNLINTSLTIQEQLNSKIDISNNNSNSFNGINTFGSSSTVNLNGVINLNNNIITNTKTITPTELSYLDGLNSNIQNQINNISGPIWVSIATSNNMTTLISSSTATSLQKIYSVSTGNGPTYYNITMPNNYYLDYQYCIFGKTLKLKYNFLCKDRTGMSAGYQSYLFPINVPNISVNTSLVSTKSDWVANQNYGSITADSANGYNWEGFNYSSKIGTGWVANGTGYSGPTEVILFNYTTNLINNQPHQWNYKAIMMNINEGSFRPFISDNRGGLNGALWINYKFECEIPIL
jgi:hypothetical protein